jgi:hypothetical protein
MRRLVVLVALVVAAGCGGGDEHASDGADTSAQETSTTTETEASPPRTYDDLLALLPPLDEPASEEVEAYRRAAFETFFGRCVTSEGGADQTEWETANAKLLDELPGYPEAALTSSTPSTIGTATAVPRASARRPRGRRTARTVFPPAP